MTTYDYTKDFVFSVVMAHVDAQPLSREEKCALFEHLLYDQNQQEQVLQLVYAFCVREKT